MGAPPPPGGYIGEEEPARCCGTGSAAEPAVDPPELGAVGAAGGPPGAGRNDAETPSPWRAAETAARDTPAEPPSPARPPGDGLAAPPALGWVLTSAAFTVAGRDVPATGVVVGRPPLPGATASPAPPALSWVLTPAAFTMAGRDVPATGVVVGRLPLPGRTASPAPPPADGAVVDVVGVGRAPPPVLVPPVGAGPVVPAVVRPRDAEASRVSRAVLTAGALWVTVVRGAAAGAAVDPGEVVPIAEAVVPGMLRPARAGCATDVATATRVLVGVGETEPTTPVRRAVADVASAPVVRRPAPPSGRVAAVPVVATNSA